MTRSFREIIVNIFKRKSVMKIYTYGSEVLKKQTAVVDVVNDEILATVEAMMKSMKNADGVGLAAPQVGLSLKLVVLGLSMPDLEKKQIVTPGEMFLLPKMPLCILNPEIIEFSKETSIAEEGCLSIPGIYAKVERPVQITLNAKMLNGEHISFECGGFLARALQHEIDHLNGILFVDRLSKSEFNNIRFELKKIIKKNNKKRFLKGKR
jgi:peptide deformylase